MRISIQAAALASAILVPTLASAQMHASPDLLLRLGCARVESGGLGYHVDVPPSYPDSGYVRLFKARASGGSRQVLDELTFTFAGGRLKVAASGRRGGRGGRRVSASPEASQVGQEVSARCSAVRAATGGGPHALATDRPTWSTLSGSDARAEFAISSRSRHPYPYEIWTFHAGPEEEVRIAHRGAAGHHSIDVGQMRPDGTRQRLAHFGKAHVVTFVPERAGEHWLRIYGDLGAYELTLTRKPSPPPNSLALPLPGREPDDLQGERRKEADFARILAEVERLQEAAGAALQRGDPAAAERLFAQITRLAPQEPSGWYNRGIALYQLKRWTELVPVAERVVELLPHMENALLMLANAYKETGQMEKALEVMRRLEALEKTGDLER